MARTFRPVALAAARAASAKKGEDIALLHVARTSPIADYLLIVTANSKPHLETLEHEVKKAAHDLSIACLRRARPESAQWRVLDFGGLLVHIMTPETRDFYALEKLYHLSPRVHWEDDHGRPTTPRARRPRAHGRAP